MNEKKLLEIVETNLRKILEFSPFANFEGINTTEEFKSVIETDPAFAPFSLNREKYVTARIGGNLITSLHRKLGDLYEELIIELLSETFGLSKEYLKYSLEVQIGNELQKRTTDGRIMLDDVPNVDLQNLVKGCIDGNRGSFLLSDWRQQTYSGRQRHGFRTKNKKDRADNAYLL
jgi:hypothetical protein